MKGFLIQIINKFDNNIHPKRVQAVFGYLRSILVTIGAIFLSVCIGIVGFMLVEGFSFTDALYMTIITISTVGFGEVRELTEAGRLFVIFLIITNISVFAYSVTNLSKFIFAGDARRIFNDLFVGRKIDKMKNHIIVCGYGRYGSSVIKHLLEQNIQVVLIEGNINIVSEIRQNKSVTVLEGDATDELTLLEAGVNSARALITTLPIDADNVYTILTARQLNAEMSIISRANKASSKPNMIRAGADHVLIPESIGGFYMSALVTKPDIISVFSEISGFETNQFKMAEIILTHLPERLQGKTLEDLDFENNTGVKIIGIKYKGEKFTVNPPSKSELKEGTAIFVVGSQSQVDRFHSLTSEFEIIQ